MTFRQDRTARPGFTRLCNRHAALAMLATACIALSAQPAAAQRGHSNVIIDYSVLDELGPAPNVPQVLMPRGGGFMTPPPGAPTSPVLRGSQRATGNEIHLTPPRSTSRRTATKSTKRKSTAGTKASAKAEAKSAPKTQPKARTDEPGQDAAGATPARKEVAAPAPSVAPPPPPPITPLPMPPASSLAASRPGPPEPLSAPSKAATAASALTAAAAAQPVPPPAPPIVALPAAPQPPAASQQPVAAAPQKVAAKPPDEAKDSNALRLAFDAGSARIGPDATGILKRVAQSMAGDDKLRVQLLAYAGGTEETASQARRLSLSRALAARSYLIGEGVRSTRIDVRALGNKSEGGPADRIDVVVTRR